MGGFSHPSLHHPITPATIFHGIRRLQSAALKALMAAVAERLVLGVFASAPGDGFLLLDFGFEGGELRALVGAVAKRLGFGTSAGAPPIKARLRRLHDGEFLKNDRITHKPHCNHNPPPRKQKCPQLLASVMAGRAGSPLPAAQRVETLVPLRMPDGGQRTARPTLSMNRVGASSPQPSPPQVCGGEGEEARGGSGAQGALSVRGNLSPPRRARSARPTLQN